MGKIESKLLWMNYFRNGLDKHNEFLVRFCSIVLYHIDEFNESYEKIFSYKVVKKALKDLTASVYNLNSCATKQDIAASVRLLLVDIMENYNGSEEYMLTQIPELEKTDMFDHYIKTADESCDELNDEETIDDILDGLKKVEREIMSEWVDSKTHKYNIYSQKQSY